jgi:hypothetical protein
MHPIRPSKRNGKSWQWNGTCRRISLRRLPSDFRSTLCEARLGLAPASSSGLDRHPLSDAGCSTGGAQLKVRRGKGTGFHRRQNLKAARPAAAYRSGAKDPAAAFMSDVTRLGREGAPRERENAFKVMRDSR